MRYGQTATSEQMTLVAEEKTTQRKRSIPIYRVTLVREGKMPTYESRIRSSASASAILQEYLADTDREHFVILMLDQKKSGDRYPYGVDRKSHGFGRASERDL